MRLEYATHSPARVTYRTRALCRDPFRGDAFHTTPMTRHPRVQREPPPHLCAAACCTPSRKLPAPKGRRWATLLRGACYTQSWPTAARPSAGRVLRPRPASCRHGSQSTLRGATAVGYRTRECNGSSRVGLQARRYKWQDRAGQLQSVGEERGTPCRCQLSSEKVYAQFDAK